MLRLFKNDGYVVNFDTNTDAELFMSENPGAVELDDATITKVFGSYARFAGPHNTSVDPDGNITFTFDEDAHLAGLAYVARKQRDSMLRDCDWRFIPGNEAYRSEQWGTYRDALRDLTSQAGFPTLITWPTPPE